MPGDCCRVSITCSTICDSICASVAAARRNEQVADHALAALVDEERVADDAAALDRGIAGQDFGVDVAQDHLRRTAIVPGEQAAPRLDFLVEQRSADRRMRSA